MISRAGILDNVVALKQRVLFNIKLLQRGNYIIQVDVHKTVIIELAVW